MARTGCGPRTGPLAPTITWITDEANLSIQEIQGGMVGLVAGVLQTSDPRHPALKALPNLSLNVSDTLRATRAEC